MTYAQHDRIEEVLLRELGANGPIPLQNVPRIFENNGLDKTVYAASGLKRWLNENCKTLTVYQDEKDRNFLIEAQFKSLVGIIRAEIERNGFVFCARVPGFMKELGLPEWRTLAEGGENLPAWLKRMFPYFKHGMKNNAAALFSPKSDIVESETQPAQKPKENQTDVCLRRLSLKFAYIPMTVAMTAELRALLGNEELTLADWFNVCVRRLGSYLLGQDEGLMFGRCGAELRIAFPMDMQTPSGQNLYAILVPNKPEASQPWHLVAFCYPGQKHADGYGSWLCRTFGLPSEDQELVNSAHQQLRQQLETLQALQTELLPETAAVTQAITQGRPLPQPLAQKIAAYQDAWDAVQGAAEDAALPLPADGLTLAGIGTLLGSYDAADERRRRAADAFAALARGAWSLLKENWLIADGTGGAERDIDDWEQQWAGETNAAAAAAACRELLQPYRAFRELTENRDHFDDAAARAVAEVGAHFRIEAGLSPLTVKTVFCAPMQQEPEKFDFLKDIDTLAPLLDALEAEGKAEGEPYAAAAQQSGVPELLEEIIDGKAPIQSILASFAAPDALEMALMLGQSENVKKLLEDPAAAAELELDGETVQKLLARVEDLSAFVDDMTFYGAGMRLLSFVDGRHGQAERCFLVGLALKEMPCVQGLLDLYAPAERSREISLLYRAFNDKISEESRYAISGLLLRSGDLDPQEAIRADLFSVLTPQFMAQLEAHEVLLDTETALALTRAYAKLENPFVRYVVFLSADLQNYIQHPENIEQLQAAGYPMTMEQLVSLTKSGNYAKGHSALDVARRLYAFMGSWDQVAQTFAALAPDTAQTHALQLCIARDANDERRMMEILKNDAELRAENAGEYRELLFRHAEYADFLANIGGDRELSPREQMQSAIAALHTGHTEVTLPEPARDPESAADIGLARALASMLRQSGQTELLQGWLQRMFAQMLQNGDADALRQTVTVDGGMTPAELAALQERALADGCTDLAIYCANILDVEPERVAAQSKARLDGLMAEATGQDSPDPLKAIRTIQLLFARQYEEYLPQLLPVRFDAELDSFARTDNADAVAAMFDPALPPQTLCALLDHLAGHPLAQTLVARPELHEKLAAVCTEKGLEEESLRFFHRYRGAGQDDFDRFLCRQYLKALTAGAFPAELLDEAEDFVLAQMAGTKDTRVAVCLYRMEALRGRLPYRCFVLDYLAQSASPEEDPELAEWLRAEKEQLPPDAPGGELALFGAVLDDPAADVYAYLSFCGAFQTVSDEEKADISEMTRDYASEAESIPLLHQLYQEPQNSAYWALCSRLPFRNRPGTYARLLFCSAQTQSAAPDKDAPTENADLRAWSQCVDFCRKNDQNEQLLLALASWAEQILAHYSNNFFWYTPKALMKVLEELCEDGQAVRQWPREGSDRLVNSLCEMFRRINANAVDDSNHNTLRLIIQLAAESATEDTVLGSRPIRESLLGQNRRLLPVLALRLLQEGRAEKALEILRQAVQIREGMPYRQLTEELAAMSSADLEAWRATPVAQKLIRFILPDGNSVSGAKLRELALDCLTDGDPEVGLEAVEVLLRENPDDSMLYTMLFILSKQDFRGDLQRIYRALAGVFRTYAVDDKGREMTWLYTRSRRELFRLLIITRVVMLRLQEPLPEEDRDLGSFLRDASLICVEGRSDRNAFVKRYTSLAEEVESKFAGYDADGVELWIDALMGAVTGNWSPFLKRAYEQKIISARYFSCTEYSYWGFLRSALLVMRTLPDTERRDFKRWLAQNSDAVEKQYGSAEASETRPGQLPLAKKQPYQRPLYRYCFIIIPAFFKGKTLDRVSIPMLSLPWEEHFLCLGDVRYGVIGAEASCYRWMMENTPLEELTETLRVFTQVAQDVLRAQVLFTEAENSFDRGEDKKAAAFYAVMANNLGKNSNVWVSYPLRYEPAPEVKLEYQELYACRNWICRAFSGDTGTQEQLSSVFFSSSRCLNMLVTLLCSKRANEIHRLAGFFSGENRRLCLEILTLISPDAADEEKLEIYDTFKKDPDLSIGLALLLSRQKEGDNRYLFLSDGSKGRELAVYAEKTAQTHEMSVCFLPMRHEAPRAAFEQTEPAPALDEHEDGADKQDKDDATPTASGAESALPAFALDAQGRLIGQKLPSRPVLAKEYEACGPFEYAKRMELSGKLYVLACGSGTANAQTINESLIQYGLDYFAFHTSGEPDSSLALAFRAEHELAVYCKALAPTGDSYQKFLNNVPVALQRMLRSAATVDALVDDYRSNKQGYEILLGFAQDRLSFLPRLFAVIRNLESAYGSIDGPKLQNIESYKSAYSNALKQLESLTIPRVGAEEWIQVRNRLITLLYDALNSLDERPDLSVAVLNYRGTGKRADAIFGELQNTGRERAVDITLQATLTDGTSVWTSRKYGYQNLLPTEKVAFAIDYEVKDAECRKLQYTLNVTYYHDQRRMNSDPVQGELDIVETELPDFEEEPYATDYPVEFTVVDGRVQGKNFYGREHQMAQIRSTVADRPFAEFKSFMLQGIRRSGKTSLLNYFEAYVTAGFPGVAVVRVDCQSIVSHPIQTAFITKVISALERKRPYLAESAAWKRLNERWQLAAGAEDCDPSRLQDFYLDLDMALHTPPEEEAPAGDAAAYAGLLLLIDEFDVMLHRMQTGSQDIALLQGIRTMTQSNECRHAVHFVLCGSNNLISYTRKGERYYQTFQDFKPQITVDELPQADLEKMLREPYRANGEVHLPAETLEWVRRYTGGLVWYTKLLGNQMVRTAKKKQRNVVYPSDVCSAFAGICEKGHCLQFYEGCDDFDHDVLEAMASQTNRYESYVTLDRIKDLLAGLGKGTAPAAAEGETAPAQALPEGRIRDSLEKLIDLKLICRDRVGRDRYRFNHEIYRRFFRTQVTRFEKNESLADVMEPQNISKKKTDDEF